MLRPSYFFARAASRLRALTAKGGIARDLTAPAMAIGSNPLSSTRKSARATVGSVFQEFFEVLMGWRGLQRSAANIFLLGRLSTAKFRTESPCDQIWVPKRDGQSGGW